MHLDFGMICRSWFCMPVDLHSHSTASDGSLSPSELARAFAASGIRVAGLTDHDTMGGVREFVSACGEKGIVGIGGIEFSTVIDGLEVHLLGYGLPTDDPRCASFLARHAQYMKHRFEETAKKLASFGFVIDIEDVYRISDGNPAMPPHVLRSLVETGVLSGLGDAVAFFWEYLATNAKAWVPHETPFEAPLEMMNEVGALAIVSHPLRLPGLSFLEKLLDMGADGVELYYPDQTGAYFRDLNALALRRGCVVTGGCDYHGAFAERRIGEIEIPIEVAERLFEALGLRSSIPITEGGNA
jgi:hypothetical protein